MVLKSLGVAGDSDSGVTLVESLDELVAEIVDDLYLRHFGLERDDPLLNHEDALRLAREVVKHPATELRPKEPPPDSRAAVCVNFAKDVLAELEVRKRRRGILGYDDLLTRLADALNADDSPAQLRMHQRWPIVMVDEFQDTDPVQWKVIHRAFTEPLHADPDRRPEAGHLRVPRRRHRHVSQRGRNRGRADDARQELAQRRSAGRPTAGAAAAALGSETSGSSFTRSRRSTTARDSRARRATTRSGCGWCTVTRSAAAELERSRSTTCARTSRTTWPPTSEVC